MKAGKVWGETRQILANGVFEFHRIAVKRDHFCSEHKHNQKWNGFYVESGLLLIRVWKNDYDLVDETRLGPGDFCQVKPGEYHQFIAIEDTIAFEVYWAHFDHGDIERKNHGGAPDDGSPAVRSNN